MLMRKSNAQLHTEYDHSHVKRPGVNKREKLGKILTVVGTGHWTNCTFFYLTVCFKMFFNYMCYNQKGTF